MKEWTNINTELAKAFLLLHCGILHRMGFSIKLKRRRIKRKDWYYAALCFRLKERKNRRNGKRALPFYLENNCNCWRQSRGERFMEWLLIPGHFLLQVTCTTPLVTEPITRCKVKLQSKNNNWKCGRILHSFCPLRYFQWSEG